MAHSATPTIKAECHSDDRVFEVRFDALPFFLRASDQEIEDLARCGWGGDYPADAVAYFVEDQNPDISAMLGYCQRRRGLGFEVYVDPARAVTWLRQNRRFLLERLVAEGAYEPPPELRSVTVEYREADGPDRQFFVCEAEDDEHAREQCENAYPGAQIVGVIESPTVVALPTPLPRTKADDPFAASTRILRAQLQDANVAFKTAGGRGVELADFIDAARRELRSRGARKGWESRRAAGASRP